MSEGGKRVKVRERRCEDRTGMCFEGGGRGHEPSNVGGLWRMNKARKLSPRASRRNAAQPNLDFSTVRPVSDF